MRMRQRRIERLLLRADVALEAGCEEDAREALAEAEQLSPDEAGLAELRARLADLEAVGQRGDPELTDLEEAVPSQPFTAGRRIPRIAAIVTICAALGWVDAPRMSAPLSRIGSQASATQNQPAEQHPEELLPAGLVSAIHTPAENALSRSPNSSPDGRESEPPAPAFDALLLPELSVLPAVAQVEPPVPPETPAVPFSSVLLLATAPAVAPPVAALELPPAFPVTMPTDPTPPGRTLAAEEVGIRATLARYESAYSQLDVEAASAVWPGVDRRALVRVFDGLASQRVSLGACDVQVIGEVAVAECVGSTTSTPKAGGRTRSQQRQWQFRLRNFPTGWQIVGATVR